MLEIQGIVEDIIFHADDTGFTVMEMQVEGELLTVVGEILDLTRGEELLARGDYLSHPTYGRQFRGEYFERILPTTAVAILRYLSGGAVKGIGPATAQRIVAKFGDKTLDVLETDPSQLATIRGISPKKAAAIGEDYRRLLGVRAVMAFLTAHQIEPIHAILAWKKWGGLTRERIGSDPFCLCERDIGVPFEQADAIAASLGIDRTAPCRTQGGVLYVLSHNLQNGHSCLPTHQLIATTVTLLDAVSPEEIETEILSLRETGLLLGEEIEGILYLYLPEQYHAEVEIAERLGLMLSFPSQDAPVSMEEISLLEETLQISYAERQREAIRTAIDAPVMILTGGPGTGKTTTLNGILNLLENRAMKVALAAPTGRAAKRMSEVTGREAKTIHRLLEVDFGSEAAGSPKFKRNQKNPLPFDAIVVDEMSMVDALLFQSLLRATRTSARLILVGDPDQLPSVGAGNVLRDLMDSGAVPCIGLVEVFRQAANSLIVTSAHAIVSGQLPPLGRNDSDFFFLPSSNAEMTAITVSDLAVRRLPKAYGYSPIRDIQVISPTKLGMSGTTELNRRLQEAINPPDPQKTEYRHGGLLLREGDKVMQMKNNYDIEWERPDGEAGLGIFNGDIGFVEMIDKPSRSVLLRFDDRKALYTFDMLTEIDLAYAITVHKSQGNEFDAVILPLLGRHRRLHYRNLLYTAVTRAKKLLILVGHADTVAAMVENNRKTLRYTNLAVRLRQPKEAADGFFG